jgi:uncharacterized protein (TIGR00296 family)/AmmeMemoRadiSam system protein B
MSIKDYTNNKSNYLAIKSTELDIKSHPKYYFTNINWKPQFQFGTKSDNSLILPHAGINIVNPIFEFVFSNIKRDFTNIIILSTNHSANGNFQCSYQKIKDFNINLKIIDGIEINNSKFLNEHSYLSVLPYVAKFEIPVSIIVVGEYNEKDIELIYDNISPNTLLIANTDLLHCGEGYGESCPVSPSVDSYNHDTINRILQGDDYYEESSMCGTNCIKTMIKLLIKRNLNFFSFLYTSSDKLLNKKDSSVGYVGINYNNSPNKDNYEELLRLPRLLIESDLLRNHYGKRLSPSDKINIIDKFKVRHNIKYIVDIFNISGIFVTITKGDKLAGCIGTFELIDDIINTILDRTLETAFNDTRFDPIKKEYLNLYKYKINFLEVPFSIGAKSSDIITKLKIGKHGITIHFKDGASATYLPSVLSELGISQQNLNSTVNNLIKSLANKSGTNNWKEIKKIELYNGIEYDE